MVHKKIESMSGVPFCHHTKGSPFEHNCRHAAYGAHKTEEEYERFVEQERAAGRAITRR